MNKFSNQNNKEFNENLNDSNFEKEGEYIINKKPKYKYNIKIVNEYQNPKFPKRAKTPDQFISSPNLTKLNNSKKNHYLEQNNNDSTIIFYSNNNPERTNNINNKYFQKNNYFCRCNFGNINNNKNCICRDEFNKLLKSNYGQFFYKYNYNYNNHCYKYENVLLINNDCNRELNNPYKRKKIYLGNASNNQKDKHYYFHSPLKNNNNNVPNINNKNIGNGNNNYNYSLKQNSSAKKLKRYTNKKIKLSLENNEENHNFSNYSFISIDNTKNKNFSPYRSLIIANKRTNKLNKCSLYKLQKNKENNENIDNNDNTTLLSKRSNSKKNNGIIINKSSETKQQIKIIPLNQKIKPLIIKKIVDKPKIKQIINKDGSISDVIMQNKIETSIESKPIINNENESIIKESITKVYTTLTKNLEENENGNNILINENNDFNKNLEENNIEDNNFFNRNNEEIIINNNKENNSVFIRRDFKNKKRNDCKLEVMNEPINAEKNYSLNNIEKVNNNNEIDIEINDNSTIPKNSDYNSFGFNSSYFIENKMMNKNEQINYIKYLYYNDIKNLQNYILKLKEEDRENIVNYFNDGNIENRKIYMQLKDILKDKKIEQEISIIINDDSFEDKK